MHAVNGEMNLLLRVVLQEPPAAKLWQLRWCMAKKDMDKASLVARCLHVNADLASVQSTPAPLAARISLSLQAESLSLSLLVPGPTPHVNAAASPKELLSLKLDNVQAGSHELLCCHFFRDGKHQGASVTKHAQSIVAMIAANGCCCVSLGTEACRDVT